MATGKTFKSSSSSRSSLTRAVSSPSKSTSTKVSTPTKTSTVTLKKAATPSSGSSSKTTWSSSSSTGKSWSNTSASKAISSWSNAASKLTSSISKSSGGSSSWSSSGSTGKSISSVTSKWTTARNNLTSSVGRSSGSGSSSSWGGSSSSSSGISSRSALTEAISKAANNKNASVSSNWWNTVISTKSDTNKLIPGTSIKSGGSTNTQVFDENWNLISDIDEYWKWLWQEEIDDELLWAQSNDDEDEEYNLNPNEDTIWWEEEDEGNEGNYMSKEDIMNMVDDAVNERDNYRQENINDLKEKYESNETAEPSKSTEEQRLETPAFNQFSWNSFVENRPAELSPVTVPNPNDPLTDPSSYDEPITQALNKLWLDLWEQTPQQVDNAENTQAVNTAEGMPEYTGDINSTIQWYANVFNNIENQWINARTARQFAQAYNKAKWDIQKYAQDNWLSQEEYERLLAQLRSHPLIQDLSNNQDQWRR